MGAAMSPKEIKEPAGTCASQGLPSGNACSTRCLLVAVGLLVLQGRAKNVVFISLDGRSRFVLGRQLRQLPLGDYPTRG
jgi:hypothetical protein